MLTGYGGIRTKFNGEKRIELYCSQRSGREPGHFTAVLEAAFTGEF